MMLQAPSSRRAMVKMTLRDEAVLSMLNRVARSRFVSIVHEMLDPASDRWVKDIRARISKKWALDGVSGKFPRRRSGMLRDSIAKRLSRRGSTVQLRLGAINEPPRYASIQEFGGAIKKSGRKLAIPLPAALNSKGLPRFSPRGAKGVFRSTWVAHDVIFGRKGKHGEPVPLFALKDKVRIPRRPYVGPQKPIIRREIKQIMRDALTRTVHG